MNFILWILKYEWILEVINVQIGEIDLSVPKSQRKFYVKSHPMVNWIKLLTILSSRWYLLFKFWDGYFFFWFNLYYCKLLFLHIEDIEDRFMRLPICTGCNKIYPDASMSAAETRQSHMCHINPLNKAWKDCPRA